MPAKLAARARVFDTGSAGKTDAHDAHANVMVALRTQGLRKLTVDEGLTVRCGCSRTGAMSCPAAAPRS